MAAVKLLMALGVFELVMWGSDVVGVHTALNEGKPMKTEDRITAGMINAFPILMLAASIAWLQYLNEHTEEVVSADDDSDNDDHTTAASSPLFILPIGLAALLLPILFLFLGMQLFFWWIPYLFDIAPEEMREEHARQLEGVPKILPPLRHTVHIVPDVEHTLLLPLTIAAIVATVPRVVQQVQLAERSWLAAVIVAIGGIGLASLPASFTSADNLGAYVAAGTTATLATLTAVAIVTADTIVGASNKEPRLKKQQ